MGRELTIMWAFLLAFGMDGPVIMRPPVSFILFCVGVYAAIVVQQEKRVSLFAKALMSAWYLGVAYGGILVLLHADLLVLWIYVFLMTGIFVTIEICSEKDCWFATGPIKV